MSVDSLNVSSREVEGNLHVSVHASRLRRVVAEVQHHVVAAEGNLSNGLVDCRTADGHRLHIVCHGAEAHEQTA
ncbi:MAG: hypothetical protein IJP46_04710 [Prevotella sp.]|nr:hypothetical protein [Prevotella sp.]